MPTKIEWVARPGMTPESWNPVTGCNKDGMRIKISPGCDHCWAERMARRLAGRCGYPEMPHHFDVTLHEDRLDIPLHWRESRTVFAVSMGDLFHEDVPLEWVERIYQVMRRTPRHTFLLLTKRAERMKVAMSIMVQTWEGGTHGRPLPNIWLGVTAENQEMADERIPLLLQTSAAVRFVSVEPMLGAVDLSPYLGFVPTKLWPTMTSDEAIQWINERSWLDWVIAGGESGPGARPAHPDWFRSLRDQCQAAGVAFFFKQWGAWIPVDQYGASCEKKSRIADTGRVHHWPDGSDSLHIGKKAAGRLLDGREWNEWPGEG